MDDEDEIIEESQVNSNKISDLSRYVSFGLLALCFSVSVSESDYAQYLIKDFAWYLRAVAALAFISLVMDYLQYWFGLRSSIKALRDHKSTGTLNYNSAWKDWRNRMFWWKQISTFSGVLGVGLIGLLSYP